MPTYNDELYHYGVIGMKWGVRRYQNPDGSLTDAGKKHQKKLEEKAARKEIKEDREHANKNRSLLSDAELNSRINRLQREKQFRDLSNEMNHPARHKVAQLVDRYGNQMIGAMVGGAVTAIGMRYINARMDVHLAKQGFKVKGYNSDGTPTTGGNNNNDD